MNEFGQRRDRLQRPELQFGAYEFKAPPSYITRKIVDPTYVFVIDVSQFSLPQGFFQQIVQSIKMTLDYIQNPEKT
jgi:protein transport protein SEC24